MQKIDSRAKKKRIIKFMSFFFIGAGLIWLLILVLWRNDPVGFNANNAGTDNSDNILAGQHRAILMNDELLHAHFDELQKLDKAYASLLTDTTNKKGLVEMNARISGAEASFGAIIDSIAKEIQMYSNQPNENISANMIASFRLALENRRSLNNLRNAIGEDKTILDPEQKSMLKIKNELLAKETRIAELESSLVAMHKTIDDLSAASINMVKDEKDGYKAQSLDKDKKIANLTSANNSLQKENDRLAKQVSETGKNMENSENTFKSRNVSLESRNITLEKKIEDLNTEIRLAQVDCNIVRADASQIISNSKQRRLLLSEALAILNSLSKSENVNIQKKIQDKITRLNQVATNYRD